MAAAALTAYLTTTIKLRSERSALNESWRSRVLERYFEGNQNFEKLAQQFAIGVLFYEDKANAGHHDKRFIPKNFNLTIGRDETCDIRSLDMHVSRIHALVSSNEKEVFIEDIFATNRTMVNGKEIHELTKLKDNDVIKIGLIDFKFKKLNGWNS